MPPKKRLTDEQLSVLIRRAIYAAPGSPPALAVGYGRVSSSGQVQGSSLDGQRLDIDDWATGANIIVTRHYEEPGESAWKGQRPVFQQLLADLPDLVAQGVRYVVVYLLDRFARNTTYGLDVIERLRQHGVALIAVENMVDYSSPDGWKSLIERLASAEHYSHNLSKVMKTTARREVVRERRHVGPVPTGYTRQNKQLIPNGDAAAIQTLFRLYATGLHSLTSAAETMNSQGHYVWNIQTGQVMPYTKYSVIGMLHNSVYIGKVRYQGIDYDGHHQAIIDQETWDTVQTILNQRAHKRGWTPISAGQGLLSEIIRCEQCDGRMWQHHKTTHNRVYYECSNHQRGQCSMTAVRNDHIDPEMLRIIGALRLPADWQTDIIAAAQRQLPQPQQQPDPTVGLAALKQAFLNDRISADEYEQQRLGLSRAPISPRQATAAIDVPAALAWLNNLEALLQASPLTERRVVLQSLMAAVWVTKKGIAAFQPRQPYMDLMAIMQQYSRAVSRGGSHPTLWDIPPIWISYNVPYFLPVRGAYGA